MFIDAQTALSDAQALSGAATTVSTNSYDSGAAANNIAAGEPLGIFFTVDVAADATDADETYKFDVIQSAAAALTSPDILSEVAIARATLVAGFKFCLPIPPHLKTKRHLGAQYILGGTTPSITISAVIQPLSMVQNNIVYPGGFTVS